MTRKILIDMDGVLADLSAQLVDFTKDPTIVAENNRSDMFKKHLPRYTQHGGFLYQPKMPFADQLVNELLSLQHEGKVALAICTSVGDFYKPTSEIVTQKKRWLENHFPELDSIPVIFTTSGASKSFFANSNTMLVDDHVKNVELFANSGGRMFYWNEPSEELIKELVDVIEEWIKDNG